MTPLILVCVFSISSMHPSGLEARYTLERVDRQAIAHRMVDDADGLGAALRATCRDLAGRPADLAYFRTDAM